MRTVCWTTNHLITASKSTCIFLLLLLPFRELDRLIESILTSQKLCWNCRRGLFAMCFDIVHNGVCAQASGSDNKLSDCTYKQSQLFSIQNKTTFLSFVCYGIQFKCMLVSSELAAWKKLAQPNDYSNAYLCALSVVITIAHERDLRFKFRLSSKMGKFDQTVAKVWQSQLNGSIHNQNVLTHSWLLVYTERFLAIMTHWYSKNLSEGRGGNRWNLAQKHIQHFLQEAFVKIRKNNKNRKSCKKSQQIAKICKNRKKSQEFSNKSPDKSPLIFCTSLGDERKFVNIVYIA